MGLVVRLLEVAVTVEKGQAVPAPAAQGQQRAEHDAAVTAEHDRKAFLV